MGTAISHHQNVVSFTEIPDGSFYILAAALPWSLNPKDYFLADSYLRGRSDACFQVSRDTELKVIIKIREPLPYDPPILINLPLLLFEKEKT
ncbi:hypothetical protein [Alkalihalobacillus sp. AL-G]|uniref:hypothetical protein n=1 Tax=Alkalihalobacillus sp. AL-G TaxID=2926399 RepID=UPI00272CCB40|nr:hypothetical protein [Alkalihalobacillus sp. AL-G]WLD94666.1 hypothetical protein MOJ78_07225 [Alkalihalobacillus sp. AL-G]